jgi:Ca-activated chloride channel family protein
LFNVAKIDKNRGGIKMKRLGKGFIVAILLGMTLLAQSISAAGILTPKDSGHDAIKIIDHHLNVVLNNGFAETEVIQTFENPNSIDLEAVYSFPVPKSASISEVTIYTGEKEIHGEVLEKQKARNLYEQEKSKGNDAGLTEKNSFYDFKFNVYPVKANDTVKIRFVYYQALEIDTGIGKYVYPLEDGGTDEAGQSFWEGNSKVENTFSANIILKTAYPVTDIRMPGFETMAVTNKIDETKYETKLELKDMSLNKDLVFYYRLQDNLPGRVELIPYKESKDKSGKFMMVITPGIDLKPLNGGVDYTFVLDISGSMSDKLHTLADGVNKAIGEMNSNDRFRIILFNESTRELTNGWVNASEDNVRKYTDKVSNIASSGGTNVYVGLKEALSKLDADRATSVILVTDGVTNQGIIDPKEFHKLIKKYDVRIFGFVMGNSANWPLMRTISYASGGFNSAVSNSDDIIGQIMLAKSKMRFESLHDVKVKIRGIKTYGITDKHIDKIYRGEQIVLFGNYDKGGKAYLELNAAISGEDKVYKTEFEFPEIDTENPEIERLWAMARIEEIEVLQNADQFNEKEAKDAIKDIGLEYQIVTDYTSMVVLSDKSFEENGIERKNKKRVAKEKKAKATRRSKPVKNHRVDKKKRTFKSSSSSYGGGAVDPISGLLALLLGGFSMMFSDRRRK